MKKTINIALKTMAMAALLMAAIGAKATEVVYRIVEYNKSTGEFTLAASGMVPKGAYASFENEFGATTGNRYNQIPRNKKAMLYLDGWQGCTIKSITLSLCSNNKAGQLGLALSDGDQQLFVQRPSDLASDEWFGQWVSKDLGVYVDITKQMDVPALTTEEGCITLQGGTAEGSVYVNAITIQYDEAQGTPLESPLGWVYEKLVKKSTLAEGDEVMIYCKGWAAADIDGIETEHYLDVEPVPSTTDVTSPEVLRFTLGKGDDESLWTLTDQHGRRLGATGKQALAWDEGVTQWSITLGYDGATIASSNAAYGTLRYNAPTDNYARFNVYTSTTLPLPYLYRKVRQNEPVVATSLAFGTAEVTADLSEGHVALRPTLMPTSTTDKRILWESDNERVAMVNGGYVTLLSAGDATITARTHDGGAEASILLHVTSDTGIHSATTTKPQQGVRKVVEGSHVVIEAPQGRYGLGGAKM